MSVNELLPFLRKPSRYIGRELHSVRKQWQGCELRMVLVFPDLYELGMSHQGLQILYRAVNNQPGFLAERAYAPDLDLEALLRKRGEPLFSLESHRPLGDFDVIGITLPYELCYSNILTILHLAGMPAWAKDRGEAVPLVIGGGSCSLNPEPVADFFDAILLGDGEEAILEMAGVIRDGRRQGWLRKEVLDQLAEIPGVYVPSLFAPCYDGQGRLAGITPLKTGYETVRRRVLPDLEGAVTPYPPLVPNTRIVHDRLGIEIARGCTRGCRFCQAGIIYRPVRERSPAAVMEMATAGIAASGFDELALLSLSSGDYHCLSQLLPALIDTFASRRVSVSMPSMRVGTLTPETMAQIRRVRKTGFTLAPEAGTERLRQVINKGITEADLLATCRSAFALGWHLLKFYFMVGLPTETDADLEAIGELLRKALRTTTGPRCGINAGISIFVPKPHTPFQWEAQVSIEEGQRRVAYLKKHIPHKGVKLKYHDPHQGFLEGVFSRGDRRLAAVIEAAWQQGARFDGWAEHFRLDTWLAAGERCGVELARFLGQRSFSEVLPWQHLDSGVEQDFLRDELVRAQSGEYTPDCRVQGCQQCGVCDFQTIQPIIHEHFSRPEATPDQEQGAATPAAPQTAAGRPRHHFYRLDYSRLGEMRFLGHLELLQIFFRALSRAGAGVNFSEGFNPTPRVSFSPALPVGTESLAEYVDVDLGASLVDPEGLRTELNRQLPQGLEVARISVRPAGKSPAVVLTGYAISLGTPREDSSQQELAVALARFMSLDSMVITRQRQGLKKEVDIRAHAVELGVNEAGHIHLVMRSQPGQAGCKPLDLLRAVTGISAEQALAARVLKLWWRETGVDG